mmetsp:Transcript_17295/g.12355  ORF Transcript_17295/g.12355 Transcript_17295/m.12355 type:complete len:271 (+) Transcript_17295:124-936(+)
MFVNQTSLFADASTRPIYNYTVWGQLYTQEDFSNSGCNYNMYRYIVVILYGAFFVFNVVCSLSMEISMLPFVYMTMSYQILQITPLMHILWPTCLHNFYTFIWFVNLQTTIFQELFDVQKNYDEIDYYYTEYGFYSRMFLFNCLDAILLCCVFIFIIPILGTCSKFAKVEFLTKISRRYQTSIFHNLMLLIYLKVTVCALLQFKAWIVSDLTVGISAMLTLFFGLFVVLGLPFIHIMLLIRRATINVGVASKFKPPPPKEKKKKNLDIIE